MTTVVVETQENGIERLDTNVTGDRIVNIKLCRHIGHDCGYVMGELWRLGGLRSQVQLMNDGNWTTLQNAPDTELPFCDSFDWGDKAVFWPLAKLKQVAGFTARLPGVRHARYGFHRTCQGVINMYCERVFKAPPFSEQGRQLMQDIKSGRA